MNFFLIHDKIHFHVPIHEQGMTPDFSFLPRKTLFGNIICLETHRQRDIGKFRRVQTQLSLSALFDRKNIEMEYAECYQSVVVKNCFYSTTGNVLIFGIEGTATLSSLNFL